MSGRRGGSRHQPWGHRRVRLIILIALAPFLFGQGISAGAGPSPGADHTDGQCDGPVTLVTGKDLSQGRVRTALVGDFAKRSGIDVQIVELPSDTDLQRSQMLAAEESGNKSYDVLNVDVVWMAEFAADHAISPLPETMLTDPDGKPADFIRGPLLTARPFGQSGSLYGLPFNSDAGLLYYRPAVLRAAGVRQLPPRTWRELLDDYRAVQVMQAQTKSAEFKYAYATQLKKYEGLTVNASEFMQAYGTPLTQDDLLTSLGSSLDVWYALNSTNSDAVFSS